MRETLPALAFAALFVIGAFWALVHIPDLERLGRRTKIAILVIAAIAGAVVSQQA